MSLWFGGHVWQSAGLPPSQCLGLVPECSGNCDAQSGPARLSHPGTCWAERLGGLFLGVCARSRARQPPALLCRVRAAGVQVGVVSGHATCMQIGSTGAVACGERCEGYREQGARYRGGIVGGGAGDPPENPGLEAGRLGGAGGPGAGVGVPRSTGPGGLRDGRLGPGEQHGNLVGTRLSPRRQESCRIWGNLLQVGAPRRGSRAGGSRPECLPWCCRSAWAPAGLSGRRLPRPLPLS